MSHFTFTEFCKKYPLRDKIILCRIDADVPLNDYGLISDDMRLKDALPTINAVLEKGGLPVIIGHMGRPDGKRNENLSLDKVAERFEEYIKEGKLHAEEVYFEPTTIGEAAKKAVNTHKLENVVVVLENVRFSPNEEAKDPLARRAFAGEIAKLGDYFIDDAFAVMHRSQASITGITEFLPSCIGLYAEKEIKGIRPFLAPEKFCAALIGGAKLDKIALLSKVMKNYDNVLIGGAIAFTFMFAKGMNIGTSLLDKERLDEVKKLLRDYDKKIFLPSDIVVAVTNPADIKMHRFEKMETVDADEIEARMMGLDIGPQSVKTFLTHSSKAKMVFWNGPMGLVEVSPFDKATVDIAKGLSKMGNKRLVGGGDSNKVVNKLKLSGSFSHVSAGGGACLEFMGSGKLAGLDALERNHMIYSRK